MTNELCYAMWREVFWWYLKVRYFDSVSNELFGGGGGVKDGCTKENRTDGCKLYLGGRKNHPRYSPMLFQM